MTSIKKTIGNDGDEIKYFVWRFSHPELYRVYSIKKYFEPEKNDRHCIWRGNDYQEGLRIAKEANKWRKHVGKNT